MTGYKTIVVHMGRDQRRTERLELAFSLAARFDAHLVGLFATNVVRIPGFALAQAGDAIREAQERFRSEAIRGATEAFRAAAARHPGVKTEWRSSADEALDALRISARYADLVIVGQRDRDSEGETGVAPGFVDELVLSAGRPVLIVPYAGRFPSVGKHVLVAWNASSEAARAVTDGLPLLSGASSVHVMAFNPETNRVEHGESPGADIALFLARHGVKVTASRQGRADNDVGEQILSRAADLSADLIVMGAYGHSRLRELVMGGVTRTLLDSMTVPVLMSR